MLTHPFKFTPEQVWNKYIEYKKELKNNYFIKYDVIRSGDNAGKEIEIKVAEPEMIESFCLYLGISLVTFAKYAGKEYKNKQDDDLLTINNGDENSAENVKIYNEMVKVFTRIQTSIKKHQLAGAMNQMYNQQIAARINGLKDDNQTVQINIDPILHKVNDEKKLKLN